MAETCGCGGKARLVFACSGASDVGELADKAARRLARSSCAKMSCLAGLVVGMSGFIESAKGADKVLVIDGCALNCGKKAMEARGVSRFLYLRVTDCGFEKGKTPVNAQSLEAVFGRAKGLLG